MQGSMVRRIMFSRRLPWAAIAFVLAVAMSGSARAQLGTSGISGTVLDQEGAFVVGAHVTVKNIATGQTSEIRTGDNGTYKIQNLPSATYEVKIEADGFAQAVVENISVRIGQTPTITVSLKPSTTNDI